MISGFHIGSNFRRFAHGFLPPAAIAVVMLIPLIFGGLFVWSYYDPIGNLNRMPVALVNSDEGDAGQRVVDGLLERKPLDFYVVDADEARQGIADGTYYMGVEIPKDFTQSVTSVNTPDPHQAKLNVTLNETNGFIPTMLGNQTATIMTYTVSGTVGEQVANQLFIGFNTVGEGLTEAADGAKRLNEGAAEASDGGQQLDSGAVQLTTARAPSTTASASSATAPPSSTTVSADSKTAPPGWTRASARPRPAQTAWRTAW